MPSTPEFVAVSSVDEAIGALEHYGEDAIVVAGATAVTIMLQQGLIAPRALISIGGIDGLRGAERVGDAIRIGALTTHREVEQDLLVRSLLPALSRTFGVVANVRVRNAATVGGVLAEADYASDPPCMLRALDAEVEVIGPGGGRTIPIGDFVTGFFETALEPAELVTAVRVPIVPDGAGVVYEKFTSRSSEDRPCLGVAAILQLDAATSACTDLRVVVGAAAETPQRFPDVEVTAQGRFVDDQLATEIAEQYAQRIDPISDMRGTGWYRTEMVKVWVRRAILHARHTAAATAATA